MTPYYAPGTWHFAPAELEAIYENLQEELRAGKIIKYEGPWCASIVVAKKKDGSFRKCIVYNSLNNRTERDSWPLPNIEELLKRMAGYQWYSICDSVMVRLCVVIEWVVVSCLLVEYFCWYLCLKYSMCLRWVCAGHVIIISVAVCLFGAWVCVTCLLVVSIFGCFFFWICVSFLRRGDIHVISRGFCYYARPFSHLFHVAISH